MNKRLKKILLRIFDNPLRRWFRDWKPIPLCQFFKKKGWRIPKYLIGHPGATVESSSIGEFDSSPPLVITAPSGIQEGDLLVAFIGGTSNSYTAYSCTGWTLVEGISTGGESLAVFKKVATAEDESAGNYSFAVSDSEITGGMILRITGAQDDFTIRSEQQKDSGSVFGDMDLTPSAANSLILFCVFAYNSAVTVSGYGIAVSNPSWTDEGGVSPAFGRGEIGVGWAVRPQTTSTGDFSISESGFHIALAIILSPAIEIPTVTTQAVTNIEKETATGHGNITDTGGENCSKRGVCWNITGNPTVADNKSEETDSFGTGAFSRSMTGLSPGQKYYVRAYAYNSAGYGYGEQVEFNTVSEVRKDLESEGNIRVLEIEQILQSQASIKVVDIRKNLETQANLQILANADLQSQALLSPFECGGWSEIWEFWVLFQQDLKTQGNIREIIRKNLLSIGSIWKPERKDLKSKASLIFQVEKDLKTRASLSAKISKDLKGKASIFVTEFQNLRSGAALLGRQWKYLRSRGNVLSIYLRNLTSKAQILRSRTKDLKSQAEIFHSYRQNLGSKASIVARIRQELSSKAAITVLEIEGMLLSRANVVAKTWKDLGGKGSITKGEFADLRSKGNVLVPQYKDLETKADIFTRSLKDLKIRAWIKVIEIEQILESKGNILAQYSKDLKSESSISRFLEKNLESKANIWAVIRRILKSEANLFSRTRQILESKAFVILRITRIIGCRASIFVPAHRDLKSQGSIRTIYHKVLQSRASILLRYTQDLKSRAWIRVLPEFWVQFPFKIFTKSPSFDILKEGASLRISGRDTSSDIKLRELSLKITEKEVPVKITQ